MKKVLLLFFMASFFRGTAQDDTYPPLYPDKKLRIEMIASDLFVNRFTIGAAYRYKERLAAGLTIASLYGNRDMDARLFQNNNHPVRGFYTGIHQQIYLARSVNDNCAYFRATGHYQAAFVSYETQDWISFVEDGLTLYSLEDVTREYDISTLGFNLELGLEMYRDLFFFDLSIGLQLRQKVSKSDRPDVFSDNYNFLSMDYSGLSPMAGFRFGFYLD